MSVLFIIFCTFFCSVTKSNAAVDAWDGFIRAMDAWTNVLPTDPVGSSKAALLSTNIALISLASSTPDKLTTNANVILVVGDQSSAKTTTSNSLLNQVAFFVHPNVGTKVRTLIKVAPSSVASGIVCSLTYTKGGVQLIKKEGLRPDQLSELYEKSFIDIEEGLAEVTLVMPSAFGLVLMDHPGFNPNFPKTKDITQQSINEYFPSITENKGVLLITHSIVEPDPTKLTWHSIQHLDNVQPENLFVVVTRMNQFPKFIADHMLSEGIKAGDHLNALDVLNYVESRLRKLNAPNGLPSSLLSKNIYFVGGSSLTWDALNSLDYNSRWTSFKRSQETNEAKILGEIEEAIKVHFKLKPLTTDELAVFNSRVGLPVLFQELLKRQHHGVLNLAQSLDKDIVRPQLDDYQVRYDSLDKTKSQKVGQKVAALLTDYPKMFYSNTLGPQTDEKFKPAFDEAEKTAGWNLASELSIYRNLGRLVGEFPPKEFRVPAFEADIERYRKKYVAYNDLKVYRLVQLLKRNQLELTCLGFLAQEPSIDISTILKKVTAHKVISGMDFTAAIVSMIGDHYRQTYLSARAGNQFVASRVGLSFLLSSQFVLDALLKPILHGTMFSFSSGDSGLSLINPSDILSVVDKLEKKAPASTLRNRILFEELSHLIEKTNEEFSAFKERQLGNDLKEAMIAMYFYIPFTTMLGMLNEQTHSIRLTLEAALPLSLTFSPFFQHVDKSYTLEYKNYFRKDAFSQAFIQDDFEMVKSKLLEAISHEPALIHGLTEPDQIDKVKEALATLANLPQVPATTSPNGNRFAAFEKKSFFKEVISSLESLTTEEKIQLYINILSMNGGPDWPVRPDFIEMDDFDRKSFEYIFRRFTSAATYETMHITLRTIMAIQHKYSDPVEVDRFRVELFERFNSLLLGYKAPYSKLERPDSEAHLDPEKIVPFLYHYIIVGNLQAQILHSDLKFSESPLFQHFVSSSNNNKDEKYAIIRQLYTELENIKGATPTNYGPRQAFERILTVELCEFHYPKEGTTHEQLVKDVESKYKEWGHKRDVLNTYINFINQHGEKFVGFDLSSSPTVVPPKVTNQISP